MTGLPIALAQTSPVLGDLAANLDGARDAIATAAGSGARLVVLPELALSGYDLGRAARPAAIRARDPQLLALGEHGADVVIGLHEDGGHRLHNSAAYLRGGELLNLQRKLFLPTYLGWEERKHSSPGGSIGAYDTGWGRAATLICADAWQPVLPWLVTQDGAEVIFVPANSAVSEDLDVRAYWVDLLRTFARLVQAVVVFVNRVGEESGAKFWGGSCVIDPAGEYVVEAPLSTTAIVHGGVDLAALRRVRRHIPLIAEGRLALLQREIARVLDERGDV